jgi:hypothetical protein
MNKAGYAGKPLAKKLGIKEGQKFSLINVPANYFELFTDLPSIIMIKGSKRKKDLVHYFVKEQKQLVKDIVLLKESIEQNGSIWISWPKKASGVSINVTEDSIRRLAILNGLVDVKVCAVDEVWSGLKLVIPVKKRLADGMR